jgi:Fe-S cluster biogenesis protein NfuA|tara:strand:+ start:3928 stop:4185 length:258 start_codon:yes stop_codon:yes gene_type:complete
MPSYRTPSEKALFEDVLEVIELIRPSIQADGGDVEVVSVDAAGVVSIRFLGACVGCPSLDMTLQSTIETTLKSRIEGISSVEAVE